MSTLIHTQGIALDSAQYDRIGRPSRLTVLMLHHDAIVIAGPCWSVLWKNYRWTLNVLNQRITEVLHKGAHESRTEVLEGHFVIRIQRAVILYRKQYEKFKGLSRE